LRNAYMQVYTQKADIAATSVGNQFPFLAGKDSGIT
jgi:hypothetical protein